MHVHVILGGRSIYIYPAVTGDPLVIRNYRQTEKETNSITQLIIRDMPYIIAMYGHYEVTKIFNEVWFFWKHDILAATTEPTTTLSMPNRHSKQVGR